MLDAAAGAMSAAGGRHPDRRHRGHDAGLGHAVDTRLDRVRCRRPAHGRRLRRPRSRWSSIHWKVPVDLHPPSEAPEGPFAHYASPMITSANTVVVPTRIGEAKGFELRAYAGADGTPKWWLPTDYTVPLGAEQTVATADPGDAWSTTARSPWREREGRC